MLARAVRRSRAGGAFAAALVAAACASEPQPSDPTAPPVASQVVEPAPEIQPDELSLARAELEEADRCTDRERATALRAAALERILGTESEEALELLWSVGTAAHQRGELDFALRAYETLYARRESRSPADPRALGLVRMNLAEILRTQQRLPEARALGELLVASWERELPPDSEDLRKARYNLALTLRSQGDLAASQAVLETILATCEATLAPGDRELQVARLRLAAVLRARGDQLAAVAVAEPALRVLERTAPSDDPLLSSARLDLAESLNATGRASEGLELARAALDPPPQQHRAEQRARSLVFAALYTLADFEAAHAEARAWLESARRANPPDPEMVLFAQLNLGLVLRALDRLTEARPLVAEVVSAWERTRPAHALELQGARLTLAACLLSAGELLEARALLERIVTLYERRVPDDHGELQMARANLALTLLHLGDVEAARPLFEQALASFERTRPPDDLDVLRTRLNLATVHKHALELETARDLGASVLAGFERVLPEDAYDLQLARMNLANTLSMLGELEGARDLLQRVREVWEGTLPEESLALQTARLNLAVTHRFLGELEPAQVLLESALPHLERLLPLEHDSVRQAQANLAMTLRGLGRPRETADVLHRLAAGSRAALEAALVESAPREADGRAALEHDWISALLTLEIWVRRETGDTRLACEVFELIETARCLGLRAERWMRRVAAAGAAGNLERLRIELQRRSALVARASESMDEVALLAAVRERDAAQRELRELAARADGGAGAERVDFEALRAALGEREALVTTWVYLPAEPVPPRGVPTSPFHVTAFTVTKSAGLERVELGKVGPIRDAVAAWRRLGDAESGRGLGVPPAAGASGRSDSAATLRRLLVDPLPPAARAATTWTFVADGPLHLVPLDALPAASDGGPRVLGDERRIGVRTTAWERQTRAAALASPPILLAVGGVDFDGDGASTAAAPSSVASTLRGSLARFDPLPGTAREAEEVASLFTSSGSEAARVELLTGSEATVEEIGALARSARFLHLATHGFVAPESVPVASAESWPAAGTDVRMRSLALARRGLAPMAMCGLVFAGANDDGPGGDSALLTAEEIAALDLSGCEMAVLSACETGLGVERAGLGIASLQRGLQMAGARSVVTSLWKVPDESTRALMVDFYRRLWIERKPKHQALWEAKAHLRAARDDRGQPRYTWRDWAGWVLTGEPD